MGTAIQTADLNERQALFVCEVVQNGRNPADAAVIAGYSDKYGYILIKNPVVASAIHLGIRAALEVEIAPQALKVARDLMNDKDAPARVRADIAIKLLDRAGHVAPAKRDDAPSKPLSEMNQAELLAFIEDNQQKIDAAEGRLAGQAIDVSPQVGAEHGVKPLSYMD